MKSKQAKNRSRLWVIALLCITALVLQMEGEASAEPVTNQGVSGVRGSVETSPSRNVAQPAEETIEALLAVVTTTHVIFIRNGKDYPGPMAVDHLRKKYEHFKKEIRTPEDFIRRCGTKSLRSGKAYRVRLKDGKEMPCADWLTEALKTMRAGNGAAGPAPAIPGSPAAVPE